VKLLFVKPVGSFALSFIQKKKLLLFNTEFQVHEIIPTMRLHAYKLNGSCSTNTNNTIGAGTNSFVVSVRHGLSTETKTHTQKRIIL